MYDLDGFFKDYMSLENTGSIKGIFVWIIIFCHKRDYIIKKKYIFILIIKNLHQNMVAMFLFYSGFGIYESLKKKGINYSKTLLNKAIKWKIHIFSIILNRINKTNFNIHDYKDILFLKAQIIILLYLTVNILVVKKKITLNQYLLSIIFYKTLGNSNWFAFTIIAFYLYSYVSFRFIKNIKFGIIIITHICILHIIFVYNLYYPKNVLPTETTLCFISGFLYSLINNFIDHVILESDIVYFSILSFIIYVYYYFYYTYTIIYRSIRNISFSLIVILISMKVQFKNDFLKFLNSHSFSIYLLQRISMLIVYRKKLFINNSFIQISFEFTSIFFLSSLFDKYTTFIDKYFRRNSVNPTKNNYKVINNIYINHWEKECCS